MCQTTKMEPSSSCMCPKQGCATVLGDLKLDSIAQYTLDVKYSKLPQDALTNDFFCQPFAKVPSDSTSLWYSGSHPIDKVHLITTTCR